MTGHREKPPAAPAARGRGRRPSAEVRADALRAAGEMLLESGMRGFTIEGVASRAGVSKMSLYKMWPSKGALALEGYFLVVEHALAFADTGDIRADLTDQLHAFVALLTETAAGATLRDLIGHAQSDQHLLSLYQEKYSGPRRALAVERMERAKSAGQLRADLDCESVVDQLWGACYHRLLLPDQPLTAAFADVLIRNLFDGLR